VRNFEHINAPDLESAISLLSEDAKAIAGGTDLLTEMKEKIKSPRRLINLKTIPNLSYIRYDAKEGLRIGALTTLAEIEDHPIIAEKFSVLAQAAGSAASPQLRNMGTIGGNLCQSPRCWYYRGSFNCWLKGGTKCYALDGENQYHAILGGDPCYSVHPSDLAPALMALGASVHIVGPDIDGMLSLEEFYVRPTQSRRWMNVLEPNTLIAEVQVPAPSENSNGIYLKAMERKVWSFVLVSVAAQISWDGDVVKEARIVLGGVAPIPWRAKAAEVVIQNHRITSDLAERAGEEAVARAEPLKENAYKVQLAKALVKRALLTLQKSS